MTYHPGSSLVMMVSLVPLGKQFMRGSAADESWMRNPSKSYIWNVPRHCIDALKVPNCLLSGREVVCKEATSILLSKSTSKALFVVGKSSHVQDVNHKNVARLRAINMNWSTKYVGYCQVDIANIVGAIVILNLPIR